MNTLVTSDLRIGADYTLFSEASRKSEPLIFLSLNLSSTDLRSIRSVASRTSPFAPAFSRLTAFEQLDHNWDTYGAQPIAHRASETAHEILHKLYDATLDTATSDLVPYHIAPVPNGGLQFEWRRDGRGLELWVGPDGSIDAVIDNFASSAVEKSYLNASSAVAEIEAVIG